MPHRLFIACLLLCSCSASRMIETDLYFGQTWPNGKVITEKEWNDFRANQVARVFKEGSTVIQSSGSWLDPDTHKLITEPSYVVIYFHKRSARISRQVDSLRNWYKDAFRQQSVLRVDKKVNVSF